MKRSPSSICRASTAAHASASTKSSGKRFSYSQESNTNYCYNKEVGFFHSTPHLLETALGVESTGVLTTVIFGVLGKISPPTSRPVDCQVKELSSTGVRTLIDEAFSPVLNVITASMYQLSPFLVHVPSPKPPFESNTHDRICFEAGSQPMICFPPNAGRSPIVAAKDLTRKF